MNFKSLLLAIACIAAPPTQVLSASLTPDTVDCFFNCRPQDPIPEVAPTPDTDSLFPDDATSLFGSETQFWGDLTPLTPPSQASDPLFVPLGSPDVTPSER